MSGLLRKPLYEVLVEHKYKGLKFPSGNFNTFINHLFLLVLTMELTKQEKEVLKFLVNKELKITEQQEEDIKTETPAMLAAEEKYEIILEKLLKKLK